MKIFRPGDERRVEREISLLRQISCPNLVAIIDTERIVIGGVDHTVVAYDLHSCGDLEQLLAPTAPAVAAERLVEIGHHVGSAIDALWAKRIVHRDVKPANIVVAADGRLVLVDVGFARHLDRSALTGVGMGVGTPGYMAPEQAAGRRSLTVHADAFSLGVTLYEVATKKHPFGRTQERILAAAAPPDLQRERPDLPAHLCRAIHRMMSFIPALRPKVLAPFFRSFMQGEEA